MGLDLPPVAALGRAGHRRLGLSLDHDDALATRTDGVEQRVVAEAWDDDAELLGGPDDQGALGDRDLLAVDRQRDGVLLLAHRHTPVVWSSVRAR
jgi:hypothetical protein